MENSSKFLGRVSVERQVYPRKKDGQHVEPRHVGLTLAEVVLAATDPALYIVNNLGCVAAMVDEYALREPLDRVTFAAKVDGKFKQLINVNSNDGPSWSPENIRKLLNQMPDPLESVRKCVLAGLSKAMPALKTALDESGELFRAQQLGGRKFGNGQKCESTHHFVLELAGQAYGDLHDRDFDSWRIDFAGLLDATCDEARYASATVSTRCADVETQKRGTVEASATMFKRENDTWAIAFNHNVERGWANSKAMADVQYLLRNMGKNVDVLQLPGNSGASMQTPAVPVATTGDYEDLQQQIKGCIEVIQVDQDPEVRESAEVLLVGLRKQQNENFTKHGKPRRLKGDLDKVIGATKKRVDRLIEKLHGEKNDGPLPQLATHLIKSIVIGATCVYEPEHSICWNFGDPE